MLDAQREYIKINSGGMYDDRPYRSDSVAGGKAVAYNRKACISHICIYDSRGVQIYQKSKEIFYADCRCGGIMSSGVLCV